MATQEQRLLSEPLPPAALFGQLLTGSWVSYVIAVASQLGIADCLRDEPGE
jgi:hypothetical protein